MLQQIGTYRLFWTYCLSLIIGLTAVTSVYGRGDCACSTASVVKVAQPTISCCQLSEAPPQASPKVAPTCEAPTTTELQGCCCDTHPRWAALSASVDQTTVKKGVVSKPNLGWTAWPNSVALLPKGTGTPNWLAAPLPLLLYTPPLLHKDVTVLVQSFLL